MGKENDWEAENAADTLIRAEEVKVNTSLHKKAMVIVDKRKAAIAQVTEANQSDGAAVRAKRRGTAKKEVTLR